MGGRGLLGWVVRDWDLVEAANAAAQAGGGFGARGLEVRKGWGWGWGVGANGGGKGCRRWKLGWLLKCS